MQIVGWMILLLLIVARPAFAAIEGYIEMTMTMNARANDVPRRACSLTHFRA